MDLIERGRSLSELGRTLRWSDVQAMLLHLPPTSHVRRFLAPEAAQIAEWAAPEVILLGLLHDQAEAQFLMDRGVGPRDLPKRGVIRHILFPEEASEEGDAEEGARRVGGADRDRKARSAAAEIRAQMK